MMLIIQGAIAGVPDDLDPVERQNQAQPILAPPCHAEIQAASSRHQRQQVHQMAHDERMSPTQGQVGHLGTLPTAPYQVS
jgi:hypothetical protein